MNQKLNSASNMSAYVERRRGLADEIKSKGHFVLEHWRDGKKLGELPFHNGVTDVGKQYLLSAGFLGGAATTPWYFGLIDATGVTPALADSDTSASHPGWSEFTDYDESVRQTWVKALNTGTNQVSSSAPAQVTISSGLPVSPSFIGGAFLINNNTKGGGTGVLWATGLYDAAVPIVTGDIFKMQYVTGL